MFYTIFKVLITAIIIVVASEIAKEKSLLAGLIISMPIITVLALIWLYWDTHDVEQVKDLTNNTLLMILPSLTFFIFLPVLLRFEINFIFSMIIAVLGTAVCYWIYNSRRKFSYPAAPIDSHQCLSPARASIRVAL